MKSVSSTEQALIDRFEAAYNRIKSQMEREVNNGSYDQFGNLVRQMKKEKRLYTNRFQFLMACGKLRNHIVHDVMQPGDYMAVPRASIVERLEAITAAMEQPSLVSLFNTTVQTFHTTDTLSAVLQVIHENNFSQFPIYEDSGQFAGLLTENGITRWLAHYDRRRCRAG